MSLLAEFQHQFQPVSHSCFLIAFSGGLDSTALLSLLAKLRENRPHFQLRAIHIHHGLSANADYWVKHCTQLCARLEIPLIIEKVNVDKSKGTEGGAREARYQAIVRHLQPNEMLLTAHHLQDQTETFLLALKRGSGIQGLGAMQPQSAVYNLPVFRPLLNFTRQQLEDYVRSENLPWVEDESNDDNRYDRNFLRNQVLPLLRNRWAHFDQAVRRSAQHCFEQQQLINELLADEFTQIYQKNDRTLVIASFAQTSVLKQRALLRLWLSELNLPMPSAVQLDQLIQDVIYARQDANPQFKLSDKIIRRYQHKLYVTEPFADLTKVKINVTLDQQIELPDNLGFINVTKEKQTLKVQWNQYSARLPLTEQPIQIRFAYAGKVRLTEKQTNEEMKKIWQQLGVPPWQRNRIPLIFYGETLKSAVGFFNVFT